ncbi:MAG: methyltransferase [Pseudomonadota bacterium]
MWFAPLCCLGPYHEGATTVNGEAGAFSTPLDLAWDAALELGTCQDNTGRRIIDLCAGIGVLAYTTLIRHPGAEITCIEINPEYVRVGQKLVPEATWICMDVTDIEALRKLGTFHEAISNPPYGRVRTFTGSAGVRYQGSEAEYKVIDIASEIALDGVFIIPQLSSGFEFSGVQCYQRRESQKYTSFTEATGLFLDAGMGIDTSVTADGWKGVKPRVEIALVDFTERDRSGEQTSLFESAA